MPSASPASTSRRSPPVTRLVSSSTRSGRSPNRLPGVGHGHARRASGARRSRAARRAPRSAPSTHPGARPAPRSASRSTATTSCPNRRRPAAAGASGAARRGRARSRAIARRWAPVSGYGSAAWKRAASSPSTVWRIAFDSRSSMRLRITSIVCTRSSSSNASRRRACSFSAIVSGAWIDLQRRAAVDQAEAAPDRLRHRVGDAARRSTCATRPRPSRRSPTSISCAFSLCG